MLGDYLELFRNERQTLMFGALSTFMSSPGQTFFIAGFIGSFIVSTRLTASVRGKLYLARELGSACLLLVLDHWIDRIDLRYYATLVAIGLSFSCLWSSIVVGPITLFVAFFLLRLFGQGLMTHVAVTSVSRYFGSRRGLALSVTGMGLAFAAAVLPSLIIFMINQLGWRWTYAVIGGFVLCFSLPVFARLLISRPEFTRPPSEQTGRPTPRALDGLIAVASTRYFWFALPILTFMPFSSTALVFHIEAIGLAKGWSRELVASAFGAYALGHVIGLLMSSYVVDRLTARIMMVGMNIPLFVGIAMLGLLSSATAAFLFMVCVGIGLGLVQTTVGAIWAEVYGTERLGSIRSFATMLMVVSSAAGPAALGLGLDIDMKIIDICWALLLFAGIATAMAFVSISTPVTSVTEHGN